MVNDDENSTEDAEESSRAPSPSPTIPPPNSDEFCELSIHGQLAYVKPVLTAILNDAYKPAQSRHLDFIKGGTARTRTQESAASRGTMSPDDVGKLQKCMMRWILRENRRESNIYNDLEEVGDGQQDDDAGAGIVSIDSLEVFQGNDIWTTEHGHYGTPKVSRFLSPIGCALINLD